MFISIIIIIVILVIVRRNGIHFNWTSKADVIGAVGEKAVTNVLTGLPKGYDIFYNILLENNGRTSQIDHIVVSVYGVFVIETKNIHGRIYGGANTEKWSQYLPMSRYENQEYQFLNPLWQNNGHIKALRNVIQDRNIPMYGIVVFPNQAELNIPDDVPVIHRRDILLYILSFEEKVIDEETANKISQLIISANVNCEEKREEHLENVYRRKDERDELVLSGRCPKCGGELIERYGRYGRFLGCKNYPNCRYILK